MPKWLSVVLLIAVCFVAAAIFERRRLTAMDAWCRDKGFTPLDPFVPQDHRPVAMLVAQLTGGDIDTQRWASAYSGMSGETKITFVEFSHSPTAGRPSAWFTLAAWPMPSASGPLVLIPGSDVYNQAIRQYKPRRKHAYSAKEQPVPVEAPSALQGEEAWLTEDRRKALEDWPYGGKFIFRDGYMGWITEGLITPSGADQCLFQTGSLRNELK
jgi:hypothetical protein